MLLVSESEALASDAIREVAPGPPEAAGVKVVADVRRGSRAGETGVAFVHSSAPSDVPTRAARGRSGAGCDDDLQLRDSAESPAYLESITMRPRPWRADLVEVRSRASERGREIS